MGKYHSELLMLFNLAFLMKCKYCYVHVIPQIAIGDACGSLRVENYEKYR